MVKPLEIVIFHFFYNHNVKKKKKRAGGLEKETTTKKKKGEEEKILNTLERLLVEMSITPHLSRMANNAEDRIVA